MKGFDLKEWAIIGAVSLALFGVYSYNQSTAIKPVLFQVSDSYEMIRPTAFSKDFDLSGYVVVDKTKYIHKRSPQKSAEAKVDAKKEEAKKLAEKKKKEDEAKKKAQALKDAQKKSLQVQTIGNESDSTFNNGFSKNDDNNPINPAYVTYADNNPAEESGNNKEPKKKTLAEWEKLVFSGELNQKIANELIAAHQKGELSDADFIKIVSKMLRDQSHGGEKQKLAFYILEKDVTFASFGMAAIFEKEVGGHVEALARVYKAFENSKGLIALGVALNSKNTVIRDKGFMLVTKIVNDNINNLAVQNPNPRQPASSISLNSLFSLLTPLNNLAKGPDQELASSAQQLAQRIQALRS